MAEEEVIKKSGVELFKELLRIYPCAEIEDYFKAGVWRDEVTRTDIQLISAHRKEAGAPDPIPLEEVPEPQLPKMIGFGQGFGPAGLAALAGARPVIPGILMPGAARPAGTVKAPALSIAAKLPGAAAPAAATPGGPVAELRLIALFVAKWKLEPARTKAMLAKLTAPRRRYVIQYFNTAATGVEATNALEQFLAQCEKTNAWANALVPPPATATAPTAKPAGAPRPVTIPPSAALKRPIAPPNAMMDANKRPRITMPAMAVRPPALPVQTMRTIPAAHSGKPVPPVRPVATIRPAGAGGGMIRPVAPKAKAKAQERPGELIRNLLQRF